MAGTWDMFVVLDNDEEVDAFVEGATKDNLAAIVVQLRKDLHDKQSDILTVQLTKDTLQLELTDKDGTIDTLNGTISDLNVQLTAEGQAKNDALTKLADSRAELKQQSGITKDLMARLANKKSSMGVSAESTKILIIVDTVLAPLLTRVKIKGFTDTYKEANGFDALLHMTKDEEHLDKLHAYDKVLILLGPKDIQDSQDGYDMSNKLSQAVEILKELQVQVALIELPPALGNPFTYVSMFNNQIEDLADKDVQIITYYNKIKPGCHPKILESDGHTPKLDLLTIMADAINDQFTIPEKIAKRPRKSTDKSEPPAQSTSSNKPISSSGSSQDFYAIDPVFMGRIIGQGGEKIKELQRETYTKLKVVDYNDVDDEKLAGVIIVGSTKHIAIAKQKIADIISNKRPTKRGINDTQGSKNKKPNYS